MGNSEFSILNSWLSRLDLGFYICDHRTLLVHFMNYSDVELSYSNAGFENTKPSNSATFENKMETGRGAHHLS